MTDALAKRLLAWFRDHGRHDLPWQQEPTPYHVWVSEIMLQQTQVATTVPYYRAFIARFPDVEALARADDDEVLHAWAGLGYYARARNLHEAARLIMDRHGGDLPDTLEALTDLPGIGRSTAGAILALGFGQRAPILDGNVKRVLCRYHAVEGWPGKSPVARRLWELAERHTPDERVAEYTQAIMDLGATLCTRTRPRCPECPVKGYCRARRSGQQEALPASRPPRPRPLRHSRILIARDRAGRVLLCRRPPAGIWGGLWTPPELADQEPAAACEALGLTPRGAPRALAPLRHGFTHFELEIQPVAMEVMPSAAALMDGSPRLWYNPEEDAPVGLPAPIRSLLERGTDNADDTQGQLRSAGH